METNHTCICIDFEGKTYASRRSLGEGLENAILRAFSEAVWKRGLVFLRRIEESVALLSRGLTPRVD